MFRDQLISNGRKYLAFINQDVLPPIGLYNDLLESRSGITAFLQQENKSIVQLQNQTGVAKLPKKIHKTGNGR